jgi:inosose dehydratase
MATQDGWLDPTLAPEHTELFALVKGSGYDSIMAEVPSDWDVPHYLQVLDDVGLTVAPGYFTCKYATAGIDERDILARAQVVAAQHAQLGLRDIGLGLNMDRAAVRIAHPARGAQANPDRIEAVIDLLGRISSVMLREGVRPALHPHVATWVETEAETRTVLGAFDASLMGFLPDTGHLSWAGADVGSLIADFADRIPFVHVKDCRLTVAKAGRDHDWDYCATVLAGLWVEPGRGELHLESILGGLPESFAGWLMVEVDRPDLSDPAESARVSAAWMHSTFASAH